LPSILTPALSQCLRKEQKYLSGGRHVFVPYGSSQFDNGVDNGKKTRVEGNLLEAVQRGIETGIGKFLKISAVFQK
jgi:hypothetical protein